MNEKSEDISQYFIVKKKNIFSHAITYVADCLVAGIIGAASAVKNDHPLINSIIPGRIFDRPACADPTPGQEKLLSTSCREHNLPGGKANHIPATIIYQKIKFTMGVTFNSKKADINECLC